MRSGRTLRKAPGCSARPTSWHRRARWCWSGRGWGLGRACSTLGVGREASSTYWRPGSGQAAGSSAWTPTRRTSRWPRRSLPGSGLGNVQVLTADARGTGLPSGSFDVVHARTLLVTVPQPAVVAAEMARLTRPGGWVVSVEPDTEFMLCYPRSAAYDRIAALFPPVFRRNGADPWIGRRVSELLRQAGLEDIGMQVTAQAYPAGHTRRTIRLDLLKSICPQVVEMGLASAEDLEVLDAEARAHLEDPATVVVHGLLFLTWGRRPS